MASRGDRILDYMIDRLSLPADLAGVPDELEGLVVDDYPLRQGEGTRIRVYPFEEGDGEITQSLTLHRMLVKLELIVLVPDGLAPRKAIDPLYVWCIQRLFTPDRRLGGLANTIQEIRRAWGAREGEQPHAKLLLDLLVSYQSRADNPEART